MPNHASKSKANKSKALGNLPSQRHGDNKATLHLLDNRPGAVQLRVLQAMANNSPQAKHAESLQAMEDGSSHIVAQRRQAERMFSGTTQRQESPEEELQMKVQTTPLQRQDLEDEELLQGKFESVQRQDLEEEELLQGKFATSDTPPRQLQGEAGHKKNHTGLPDNLKTGIENLSGYAMDDVKVHYNSEKPAQLQAHAYAQGTDIHVAPGQAKHLPHEAWHVVQQKQGRVKPTLQAKGVSINDDAGLEHEADVMGAKALQMQRRENSGLESGIQQLQRAVNNQAVQRNGSTKGKKVTATGPNAKFVLFGSNVTVASNKLEGTIPSQDLGSVKAKIGAAAEYPILPGLNFKAGVGLQATAGLGVGGGTYKLERTSSERTPEPESESMSESLLGHTVTDVEDKLSVNNVGLKATAGVSLEAFVGGSAGVPYIGNLDAKLFAKGGVTADLAGTVSGNLSRKKQGYDKFSGNLAATLAGNAELKASVGASIGYTIAFISGDLKVWTFKEWSLGQAKFKYEKSVTVGRAGNEGKEVAEEGLQYMKDDLGDVGSKLKDQADEATIGTADGIDKAKFNTLDPVVKEALEQHAIFSTNYSKAKKAWVKLGGNESAFPSRKDFNSNTKKGYGILLD